MALLSRLRDQDPAETPALDWLHRRLEKQGTTAEEVVAVEYRRQTAMNATVRNVITSMRLISALDWAAFFESVSLVDEVLAAHEGYRAMDFGTRDYYRHARAVHRAGRSPRDSRNDEAPVFQQMVEHAPGEGAMRAAALQCQIDALAAVGRRAAQGRRQTADGS